MRAQTYRHCFLAVIVAFALQSLSYGEVISIDFDEVTRSFTYSGSATSPGGLVPLAGQSGTWNQLAIGTAPLQNLGSNLTRSTANTNSPSFANLLDGDGAATGVTFTLNPGGANSYSSFTFGPGLSFAPTDNLGLDVAMLENNGSNRVTTDSVDWEFTNLLPNTPYDIRVFGQTDANNNPNNFGRFSIGATMLDATSGQNYVTFSNVASDATGTITGTMTKINNVSSMSGIQIDGDFTADAMIPEPASIALWVVIGIGLCGYGFRLRGRRRQ